MREDFCLLKKVFKPLCLVSYLGGVVTHIHGGH